MKNTTVQTIDTLRYTRIGLTNILINAISECLKMVLIKDSIFIKNMEFNKTFNELILNHDFKTARKLCRWAIKYFTKKKDKSSIIKWQQKYSTTLKKEINYIKKNKKFNESFESIFLIILYHIEKKDNVYTIDFNTLNSIIDTLKSLWEKSFKKYLSTNDYNSAYIVWQKMITILLANYENANYTNHRYNQIEQIQWVINKNLIQESFI